MRWRRPRRNGCCSCPGSWASRPTVPCPRRVEAQTELVLANIEACLVAAGLTRANVVRLTTFITEVEYRQGYMRVRDAWVADPPPASTLLVVKALVLPACKVEIEAIAAG